LGSQSIIVTVPAGSGVNGIGFPTYYVQALASSGSAQLTASATGYASTSFTVTMGPSGFVLVGPNGVGGNFAVLLSQGSVNLTVQAYLLDPNTLAPSSVLQAIRGGISPSVTVTSDNPAVVFASTNTQSTSVVISGGTAASTVTLSLQSTGTANILAGAPGGFNTPSYGSQLSVTIN
jgi:hypothetical protein